jgi:hypothetical protein
MAKARRESRELPPRTPCTREELDRAIMLLGNRARGLELRESTRSELLGLVGRYPDQTTAGRWKSILKDVRGDVIFKYAG